MCIPLLITLAAFPTFSHSFHFRESVPTHTGFIADQVAFSCCKLPSKQTPRTTQGFCTSHRLTTFQVQGKRSARRPLCLLARSTNLEIGVGAASLSALMINRLATVDLANAQSRADLLGVAVASAILVSALARIDLTVREKESVKLAGVDFNEVLVSLSPDAEALLRYAGEMILRVSGAARSVVVYAQDTTVARFGTMGRAQTLQAGPIVLDAMNKRKQQYLADLQILPGRVEFGYLPINTQAVLVQPIGSNCVMVVGADKVRPFTARDLVVIERLEPLLRTALEGG